MDPQQTVTCSSAFDRHAVAAREVRGDGVAQRVGAVRRRILILLGLDRRAGGVLDRLRRLEIRKALREIDGVMEFGQAGHFAEHRIGERRHAPGATDLRHYGELYRYR